MNKTALITGASGGLGLEFARLFAIDDFDLVLVARSEDRLYEIKEELESQFDINVEVCVQDLSERDAALAVYGFTSSRSIVIDALVNNAGFGDWGPFASSNWKKQYDMIQLNVTALAQLTHCYLPDMIARGEGGKILNLASVAAFQAGPLMSVYYATKAFVLSFTEALSEELKGTGIKVSALCPGPTKTGFEEAANLGRSGLFSNLKTGRAGAVACYGYDKLNAGKVVAVPGLTNKLIVTASKFAPRFLTRKVVHQIQK